MPVAVEVAALWPVNEKLCLVNVYAQRSRFAPDGQWPAARVGDKLTFKPRPPVGHFVRLITQRADQLHSLGDIVFIHGGIVVSLASSRRRNGPADNPLTEN